MNEEEYFDEIRRLKKRRKSEDDARRIIDAEKESFGGITQEEYITSLRFQLAKDIGNAAWQLPATIILKLGQTAVAGMAGVGKLIKTGSGEEATKTIEDVQSYDLPGAVGLSGPALDRSVGAVATGGEYIDVPFNWLGKKATDVTGSPAVGTAVYTGSQFAGPGLFKSLFNLGTGFGRSLGTHFLIDQRRSPEGAGDWVDAVSTGVQKITPGMKGVGGYYGSHPLDRLFQTTASITRAVGSAVKGVFSPRAAAILRQHGLSPVAVRKIQAYRKALDNPRLAKDKREHLEKVLVAELEKAYAMKLRAGEAASPELSAILVDYYPRKLEVFGIPKPKELQTVIQGDIPLHELRYLIEDMAKTMKLEGRDNVYAFGGNPARSSMAGPRNNRLKTENPAQLFTGPKTAYEMVGDIWVRIARGDRFDFTKTKPGSVVWFSKPPPGANAHKVNKYNSLDPIEFNADTLKRIMATKTTIKKADIARDAAKDYPMLSKIDEKFPKLGLRGSRRIQSQGTDVREVTISGKEYILYHVVSGSDNPMLASTPAAILLNPRTGTSRILAFDELDLLKGSSRAVLNTGLPKGFVTVNSGSFTYSNDILKQVGIKPVKDKKFVKTEKPDIDEQVGKMIKEVSAVPERLWSGSIPAITSTEDKRKWRRFENR